MKKSISVCYDRDREALLLRANFTVDQTPEVAMSEELRQLFPQIRIAQWQDPRLSIHPSRGGPRPVPLYSAQAIAQPYIPTYKVPYQPPEATDDEAPDEGKKRGKKPRRRKGREVGVLVILRPSRADDAKASATAPSEASVDNADIASAAGTALEEPASSAEPLPLPEIIPSAEPLQSSESPGPANLDLPNDSVSPSAPAPPADHVLPPEPAAAAKLAPDAEVSLPLESHIPADAISPPAFAQPIERVRSPEPAAPLEPPLPTESTPVEAATPDSASEVGSAQPSDTLSLESSVSREEGKPSEVSDPAITETTVSVEEPDSAAEPPVPKHSLASIEADGDAQHALEHEAGQDVYSKEEEEDEEAEEDEEIGPGDGSATPATEAALTHVIAPITPTPILTPEGADDVHANVVGTDEATEEKNTATDQVVPEEMQPEEEKVHVVEAATLEDKASAEVTELSQSLAAVEDAAPNEMLSSTVSTDAPREASSSQDNTLSEDTLTRQDTEDPAFSGTELTDPGISAKSGTEPASKSISAESVDSGPGKETEQKSEKPSSLAAQEFPVVKQVPSELGPEPVDETAPQNADVVIEGPLHPPEPQTDQESNLDLVETKELVDEEVSATSESESTLDSTSPRAPALDDELSGAPGVVEGEHKSPEPIPVAEKPTLAALVVPNSPTDIGSGAGTVVPLSVKESPDSNEDDRIHKADAGEEIVVPASPGPRSILKSSGSNTSSVSPVTSTSSNESDVSDRKAVQFSPETPEPKVTDRKKKKKSSRDAKGKRKRKIKLGTGHIPIENSMPVLASFGALTAASLLALDEDNAHHSSDSSSSTGSFDEDLTPSISEDKPSESAQVSAQSKAHEASVDSNQAETEEKSDPARLLHTSQDSSASAKLVEEDASETSFSEQAGSSNDIAPDATATENDDSAPSATPQPSDELKTALPGANTALPPDTESKAKVASSDDQEDVKEADSHIAESGGAQAAEVFEASASPEHTETSPTGEQTALADEAHHALDHQDKEIEAQKVLDDVVSLANPAELDKTSEMEKADTALSPVSTPTLTGALDGAKITPIHETETAEEQDRPVDTEASGFNEHQSNAGIVSLDEVDKTSEISMHEESRASLEDSSRAAAEPENSSEVNNDNQKALDNVVDEALAGNAGNDQADQALQSAGTIEAEEIQTCNKTDDQPASVPDGTQTETARPESTIHIPDETVLAKPEDENSLDEHSGEKAAHETGTPEGDVNMTKESAESATNPSHATTHAAAASDNTVVADVAEAEPVADEKPSVSQDKEEVTETTSVLIDASRLEAEVPPIEEVVADVVLPDIAAEAAIAPQVTLPNAETAEVRPIEILPCDIPPESEPIVPEQPEQPGVSEKESEEHKEEDLVAAIPKEPPQEDDLPSNKVEAVEQTPNQHDDDKEDSAGAAAGKPIEESQSTTTGPREVITEHRSPSSPIAPDKTRSRRSSNGERHRSSRTDKQRTTKEVKPAYIEMPKQKHSSRRSKMDESLARDFVYSSRNHPRTAEQEAESRRRRDARKAEERIRAAEKLEREEEELRRAARDARRAAEKRAAAEEAARLAREEAEVAARREADARRRSSVANDRQDTSRSVPRDRRMSSSLPKALNVKSGESVTRAGLFVNTSGGGSRRNTASSSSSKRPLDPPSPNKTRRDRESRDSERPSSSSKLPRETHAEAPIIEEVKPEKVRDPAAAVSSSSSSRGERPHRSTTEHKAQTDHARRDGKRTERTRKESRQTADSTRRESVQEERTRERDRRDPDRHRDGGRKDGARREGERRNKQPAQPQKSRGFFSGLLKAF